MKGLTLNKKEEKRAYVLNGILEKRWTVEEGAGLLQISERHLWRVLAAYREEGVGALVHRNRGRKPVNATPENVRQEMVRLGQGPYDGANYSHMAELLAERQGIQRSRWTVRRVLQKAGVGRVRRRRKTPHRSRRERYPQEGMLLQVDGSRHRWLGEQGPWLTLLGGVDDATGTVPHALFREQEDAQGYLLLLWGVILRKGVPLALYSDRHSIFVHSSVEPRSIEEQLAGHAEPTQVGRALEELGIESIQAHSPQAKGRVERLWQTFQDRLVTELRLARAKNIEEANSVLGTFLPKFNAQFGVPAREPGLAYRSLPPGTDLDAMLCFKYRRTVDGDNTVHFAGKTWQLQPTAQRASYTRARLEVREHLDGRVAIVHQGTILTMTEAPPGPVVLRTRGQHSARESTPGGHVRPLLPNPHGAHELGTGQGALAIKGRRVPTATSPPKPATDHPWRRYPDKFAAPSH